ncbi:MAG: sulfatase [Planctomycetota bacterium]
MLKLYQIPIAVACAALASLTTGCEPPPSPFSSGTTANVLLVTLDTCRADRLGCYGQPRVQTPSLDRLAREGITFEQAFAPIPSTLPSHASILTGLYPAQHGLHDNGAYALEDETVTLAERLQEAGYATGAFISAYVLDRQFGLGQGFDVYDGAYDLPIVNQDPRLLKERNPTLPEGLRKWLVQVALPFQRRAEQVTAAATAWLERLAARPFFLWVHYYDPHQPYQAPGRWARCYDPDYTGRMDGDMDTYFQGLRQNQITARDEENMIARYDGEISYMDEWIGHLFAALESRGSWENTLIIVAGDHGEAFGEHGQIWEHNQEIFDEAVRVPLLVRRPQGEGAGRRVAGLVRTIDLFPTVLDLLGLSCDDRLPGVSLRPLMDDPQHEAPGEILLETLRYEQIFPVDHSFLGLRTERFKLILRMGPSSRSPQDQARQDRVELAELFDLESDPREISPARLSPHEPMTPESAIVSLREQLLEMHGGLSRPPSALPLRSLDALTSDALEQLGYAKR